MNNVFVYWGCGNGYLKLLQPHIRIISGVLIGSACLLIPLKTVGGVVFLILSSLCWVMSAGMPWKMIVRCAVASLILFFPFLLLSPWITVDSQIASPMVARTTQAAGIALRSTCMLFIAASTIASLTMYDVHRGLVHMPVPRSLVVLIVQLINQTMLLVEETTRIIGVLRLRSASGVHGLRVLFSFPVVWMVRMLFRAERTASAMAVRGYGIEIAAKGETIRLTAADLTIVIGAVLLFAVSIAMRVRAFI